MKKMFLVFVLVLFFAAAAFAKVNINTADQEALTSLTGIGSTKAEAIIKYRKANGAFKSVDDLVNVKGIGDKTFEKIKGDITVEKTKSKDTKKTKSKDTKKAKSKDTKKTKSKDTKKAKSKDTKKAKKK